MLRALYLRCIAFSAIALLFICLNCLSCILGGFWRVVRGLALALVLLPCCFPSSYAVRASNSARVGFLGVR